MQGGITEGSGITSTKKTAAEAALFGRIVDGAITASGQWKNGGGVDGRWKRVP